MPIAYEMSRFYYAVFIFFFKHGFDWYRLGSDNLAADEDFEPEILKRGNSKKLN